MSDLLLRAERMYEEMIGMRPRRTHDFHEIEALLDAGGGEIIVDLGPAPASEPQGTEACTRAAAAQVQLVLRRWSADRSQVACYVPEPGLLDHVLPGSGLDKASHHGEIPTAWLQAAFGHRQAIALLPPAGFFQG